MKRNPAFLVKDRAKKRSVSLNDRVFELVMREAQRTASSASQVIRQCVLKTLDKGDDRAA